MSGAVRQTLHRLGVVCLLLAFACLSGSSGTASPRVLASIGIGINRALDHTFGHLFRRHGKHRAPLGEGPLVVNAQGGVDVAVHRQTLLGTQASSGAALNVSMERRTDQSSLTVQEPLGYTAGSGTGSQLGQIQVAYSTPKYGLSFGQIAGPTESQLGVAGFARGLDLSLPQRRGTLDLLGASGTVATGTGYHAYGIRRSLPAGRNGTLEATFLRVAGEAPGISASIADLSYIRSVRSSTATLELGYGTGYAGITTGDGTAGGRGLAWAARLDNGTAAGFTSFYARQIPAGFVTLSGLDTLDREFGMTASRRVIGGGFLTADIAQSTTGSADQASTVFRQTYQFSQPLRFGTLTLIGERSRESGAMGVTGDASLGGTLSETFHGTTLTETIERASAVGSLSTGTQSEAAFSLSRQLFGGNVSLYQSMVHGYAGGAASTERDFLAQYAHPIGRRAQIAVTAATQRSIVDGAVTSTTTTGFSLSRQLFGGLGLALTGTRVKQSGIGGGTANTLGLQITGPLNVGTQYTGRGNPNLPASIVGHVFLTDSDMAYGGARNRGAANALVVLDGARSQRTDAQGAFAFRLVTPGQHTVTVEPATLGPGTVVDRENRAVQVAGGQIASVDFYAGPFAAVAGRVFVRTANGETKPLAGVALVVDKDQTTVSGPDGRYQVGRLATGPHTVTLQDGSLPASVQLSGPKTRPVQVTQGAITSVDWTLVPLAVIAGHVMFSPDAGFGDLAGAKDVYVLAEPGDHAAITNEDGSFALADLPPGTYTLSIDPETLPDGQDVLDGPTTPFEIKGGEQIGGVRFTLGPKAKDVVFSFDDKKKVPLAVRLTPDRVPPGASIAVLVKPQEDVGKAALHIESDFVPSFPMRWDASAHAYAASFNVPLGLQPGTYALRVVLEGERTGTADASFDVDPHLPLVTVRTIPARPTPGHTIHVVAKILAPVEAGDELRFEDGYAVRLPASHGVVYAFDVRLWQRGLPYRGTITNAAHLRIPFVIGS